MALVSVDVDPKLVEFVTSRRRWFWRLFSTGAVALLMILRAFRGEFDFFGPEGFLYVLIAGLFYFSGELNLGAAVAKELRKSAR